MTSLIETVPVLSGVTSGGELKYFAYQPNHVAAGPAEILPDNESVSNCSSHQRAKGE